MSKLVTWQFDTTEEAELFNSNFDVPATYDERVGYIGGMDRIYDGSGDWIKVDDVIEMSKKPLEKLSQVLLLSEMLREANPAGSDLHRAGMSILHILEGPTE